MDYTVSEIGVKEGSLVASSSGSTGAPGKWKSGAQEFRKEQLGKTQTL
jgi:hypothetical protein